MRTSFITCLLLTAVAVSTGCTPTFSGEWLENREALKEQSALADKALPRMALEFDPVSTVRSGWFNDRAGKVDNESVQSNQYFMYDGWKTVQFGSMMGRLEGDQLVITVGKGIERHFNRVKGASIFPPHVQLPPLSARAKPVHEPIYASSAAP